MQHIHTKILMRHFATKCDALQSRKKQTQNPPRATSWGFDPPSRHQHICWHPSVHLRSDSSPDLDVDPARRICGNKLNSDSFCLNIAFISEDMYVVSTRIDKPHPCFVHMRLAVGIVTFIIRHRSRRDDDQAMPRVRMPAGASAGRPDIALHVHVRQSLCLGP